MDPLDNLIQATKGDDISGTLEAYKKAMEGVPCKRCGKRFDNGKLGAKMFYCSDVCQDAQVCKVCGGTEKSCDACEPLYCEGCRQEYEKEDEFCKGFCSYHCLETFEKS